MSYQEKKRLVNIISQVGFLILFAIEIGPQCSSIDLSSTAMMILKYIAYMVGLTVIIQIVFHVGLSVGIAVKNREAGEEVITKRVNAEFVEDERDRLMDLKGTKIGYAVAGAGLLLSIVLVAFEIISAAQMLTLIYISYALGSMVEEAVVLYLYRRG